MTRQWNLPTAESQQQYAAAVLASSSSLLPGLSGIEAYAAMAYARTLPMCRNSSVCDQWRALGDAGRSEWVAKVQRDLAAASNPPSAGRVSR